MRGNREFLAWRKKRALKWFLLLLMVLAGGVSGSEAEGPWLKDRPLTVGHRGTTVLADENTLKAYELAWQEGVDVIECDPRLTKDGVYVIMHDPTVDRTTNGHGLVKSFTLAEIKKLRTQHGEEIPTLAEVLAFARDHDLSVYLDVKEPPEDGAEALVREIESAGMAGRVIVGCYHVKTLKVVKSRAPGLSCLISWPYPISSFSVLKKWGANAVGTLVQLATPEMIASAHRHGLRVMTMPINSAEKLSEMRARGLDGLQSDDPRLLRPYGKYGSSPLRP